MANRKNTFLLKRSNIAGKIPSAGDLQLGELALNIADNILYASGTTANSILPIGWDRVARTGDTMTGGLFTPYLSATTISATTYLNLPTMSGSGLPLSGGTVSGDTTFISGITANTIYTNYIDFNTGYTGQTLPAGRLQWDDGNGTLVLGLKGGISNMEIGLENMALCFNDEATTLTAGTVVYVSGSQGNRPSIKRAIAISDGYSVTTLGIVSESIASGAEGFVTTFGMINNLNTIGYSGGTPIWLSPTVSGAFTSVKPKAPDHTVLLGYVVRVSSTVGSIFVHISNGWEIDELHDVRLNGRVQGDLLMLSGYNGSNVWVNSKTLNGSYTMTGLTVNGNVSIPTVTGATIDTDKFLVSDSGIIKFRTGTQVLSDIGGVGGSGTADYVARFTGAKTLGDGIIQDNGSTVGINATPASDALLYVSVNPPFLGTPEDYVIKAVNAPFGGLSTGLRGISSTVTNSAGGATSGEFNANSGSDDAAAGLFNAVSTFAKTATGIIVSATGGTNNYSLQLQDGTEGTNKVLISKTTDGKANWSSSLLGLTSVQTNALTVNGNITVTGGTQSWFSGNSSSDLVRITQTGTGNAFVVEDFNNPDSSQFVVDNTGNVGIGTNTPIAKLQISNTATTVNPALYTSDFVILTAEGTAPGFNIVSAGDGFGNRGVFKATRSRGTLSSPTVPQSDDMTFSLLGAIYDGVTNWATAGISFEVDGAVTANTTPQRIVFATATGNSRTERMRITSDGKVGIGTTTPTEKLVVNGNAIISGNLTVTGGTSSLFSGSSSVEMVKIIQAGSGDAFVVQDQANGDASHFVINASGNTAIGLTAPIGNDKLTVSGNTTVYGTLSATTYAGLPNSGVLVVPIATSSVAIGTGSNDYYLNFKIPYNLTISKVDFSVSTAGSDSVRIGIYRGQDLTAVLVGQSAGGTVSTLNSVPIVAEVGQNLTFSAGSWIVIGVAVGGTTTNLFGSACPVNNLIAWTNTTDSSGGFPTNPRSKAGTRTSFPSIEITVA